MISNIDNINAIVINGEIVKQVNIGSQTIFTQSFDGLKLLFVDNFTLGQLDNIPQSNE